MPGKLTKEGKDKIRKKLMRLGLKLESYWKREVPVFTGQYKNSITTEDVSWNRVVVGTNIDYAKGLEFGTDPGTWPPVDEIRKWVDRKINPQDENLDDVTYLVGRKIFQEGIDRNPSLQPAIRKFKTSEG
jgi:hypothetical protein